MGNYPIWLKAFTALLYFLVAGLGLLLARQHYIDFKRHGMTHNYAGLKNRNVCLGYVLITLVSMASAFKIMVTY